MAESSARVTAVHEIAEGTVVVTARMASPDVLAAKPGQFLSIRVDASGDVRRSYTLLATGEGGATFELLVKRVAGGAGSGYFERLAVGDVLAFTGPMGFFHPDDAHTGPSLVIATGAGIAAALPVARAVGGSVALYYGVRDEGDALLVDRLGGLIWELVVAPNWDRVHTALAQRAVEAARTMTDGRFYLAGNGDMTRAVRDALVAAGVDRKRQIRTEIFYPGREP